MVREWDKRPVGYSPRLPPGVGQQHQGEKSCHFVGVRKELVQLASQADRLTRKGDVVETRTVRGRVTLVEDEVKDVLQRRHPVRQLLGGGQREPCVDFTQAGLGSVDALRRSTTAGSGLCAETGLAQLHCVATGSR